MRSSYKSTSPLPYTSLTPASSPLLPVPPNWPGKAMANHYNTAFKMEYVGVFARPGTGGRTAGDPVCLQHTMPTLSAPHLDKPLRHSIAAILEERSPPLSACTYSNDSSPGACYLPRTALVPHAVPANQAPSPMASGNDVKKRAYLSERASDTDASPDTEEEVVVDENDDGSAVLAKAGDRLSSGGNVTEKDLPSLPPLAVKSDQKPLAAYRSTNGPFACHHPPSPSAAVRNHSVCAAITAADCLPAVRSAFRPIVRPWVAGDVTIKTAEQFSSASSKSFKNAKPVPCCPARNGHRVSLPFQHPSVDAVVALRKQSSAFVAACGFQQEVARNHLMQRSSGDAPSRLAVAGLGCGNSVAGSLASWFSWLQTRGLQLGSLYHHSHLQQQHQQPQRQPHHALQPPFQHQSLTPALHSHQAPRFNCEACGKSYSTFGGLSKHKQFHCAAQVKKDFRCKYCDKNYSSLGALKMHIRTHTLPCKCGVCGKAFSRPWLLQGHVRTHTGEKPFTCPHCARAFADRSNLRAHLQTHSDVKKYSCRACSKTFSRMSLLTKHRESSCVVFQR